MSLRGQLSAAGSADLDPECGGTPSVPDASPVPTPSRIACALFEGMQSLVGPAQQQQPAQQRVLEESLCGALREELGRQLQEWREAQERAHAEQLDHLTSLVERLLGQRGRQADEQPSIVARAPSRKSGTSHCSDRVLAVAERRQKRHHTWHEPAARAGPAFGSPTRRISAASLKQRSMPLQLPPDAMRRHFKASPKAFHVQFDRGDSRREGSQLSEDGEDGEASSAHDVAVLPRHASQPGMSPSQCITEGGSEVQSRERSEENMRWKDQWQHHMRAQVSRNLRSMREQGVLVLYAVGGEARPRPVPRRVHGESKSAVRGFQRTLSGLLGGRLKRKSSSRFKAQPKSRAEEVVDSNAFHICCGFVILCNAVFIGLQSDVAMGNALAEPRREDPQWFRTCDRVFVGIFVLEVLLRMGAKRCQFFVGSDWRWNLFDFLLVLYSLGEEVFQPMVAHAGFFNLTHIRLLGSFRMVRELRVIRVMRFFGQLRLMVCSIIQSLMSLSWALVLLLLIMYIFAICFMRGATLYLQEGKSAMRPQLDTYYGSVTATFYCLTLAVAGGADWENLVKPLSQISGFYTVLFSFYVLFVVMGVLNVLTSAFVQRASELSKLDRDLVIQSEQVSDEAFIAEMKGIFEDVDLDETGRITWESFRQFLQNDDMRAYFATQQLDTSDARELFILLDMDGNEYVEMEEFIMGCKRLRGQAKSSDVATLMRESKRASQKSRRSMRRIEVQLCNICSALNLNNGDWSHASCLQSPMSRSQCCTPASRMSPCRPRALAPRLHSDSRL